MEVETDMPRAARIPEQEQRFLQRRLTAAVESQDLIAMQAALAAGARTDGGEGGLPPLLAAAILGLQRPDGSWAALLDRLVAAGADPNQPLGAQQETALHRILGATRTWRTSPAAVVSQLVRLGADLTRQDSDGGTAVHAAARSGRPQNLQAALQAGGHADQPDRSGVRPLGALLFAAVAEPRLPWPALVDLLVGAGARLDRAGGQDVSALHLLLSLPVPRPDMIDFLIARGAPVQARDRRGRTPLHCAVENRRLEAVSLLLHAGGDPNAVDRLGRAPMDLLAGVPAEHDEMHPRIRALLRTSGARPALARQPGAGEARGLLEALWTDAEDAGGLSEELRLVGLIEQGALAPETGLPTFDGAPPLHAAAEAGLERAVESLLAAGHDPTWRDRGGRTALHRAALNGRLEVVTRLLEAGAAPDLADDIGVTPLMAAAASGDARVVAELLRAGADRRMRSFDGRSAMDHARGRVVAGIRALLATSPARDEERAVLVSSPRTGQPIGPASAFLAGLSHPEDRWALVASRAPADRLTDSLAKAGAARVERDVADRAVQPGPDAVFTLRFAGVPWTWVVRAINAEGLDHRAATLHDFALLRGLGCDAFFFTGDERVAAGVDQGALGQTVWTERRQTEALIARRGTVTTPGRALRMPGSVRLDLDEFFTRHGLWLPGIESTPNGQYAQLRLRMSDSAALERVDVLWGWPT
jgi:ankyrin repeat protein